jgi:hypothetical protein
VLDSPFDNVQSTDSTDTSESDANKDVSTAMTLSSVVSVLVSTSTITSSVSSELLHPVISMPHERKSVKIDSCFIELLLAIFVNLKFNFNRGGKKNVQIIRK